MTKWDHFNKVNQVEIMLKIVKLLSFLWCLWNNQKDDSYSTVTDNEMK